MKQPDLKTERLLLRKFRIDDASEVQNLAGNFNVSKTTLNIPYPYKLEMAEEWINSHLENKTAKTQIAYAIVKLDSQQLLRAVSLMKVDTVSLVEISTVSLMKVDTVSLVETDTINLTEIEKTQAILGYWIGEPYWGMGYCTEAVRELIQFAFQTIGLKKIVAEHLTSNPASGKVMKKAGMRHVMTTQKIDRHGENASMEIYETL